MDRNHVMAIVLSMAAVVIWSVIFVRPPTHVPQRGPGDMAVATRAPGDSTASTASSASEGTDAETLPPELPTDRSQERTVVIDSPLYHAELTNRGAALVSYRLKNYAETPKGSVGVEMVPQFDDVFTYFDKEYTGADKMTILPQLRSEFDKIWLPYSFRLRERLDLGQVIHQMEAPAGPIVLKDQETAKVVFRFNEPNGASITKTLTFHADNYITDVELDLRNSGTKTIKVIPEMVVTEGYRRTGIRPSTQYDHSLPVYSGAGARHSPTMPKPPIEIAKEDHPSLDWIAVEDLYFFSSLIPEGSAHRLWVERTPVLGLIRLVLGFDEVEIPAGQTKVLNALGYYGPKENDRLVAIGHSLDRAIDFGRFRFLALPAVDLLQAIYRFTGSYGLAIIALTILLKIVTYPLTAAQMRSMNKMKELQPEMERLKAKFKDAKDPERFNKEMMSLYQKHGVNPVSGCLPMLVQMPILFALYAGLLYSIEMRHTAFLYIPDLANRDPYFLSPLLMGGSMLLQMRMSPAPADPSQATMMRIMPIMFTGLFLFAPAGLVIYWLMNNLLAIGQQFLMQRRTKQKAAS